jgi:hypothetical protein
MHSSRTIAAVAIAFLHQLPGLADEVTVEKSRTMAGTTA